MRRTLSLCLLALLTTALTATPAAAKKKGKEPVVVAPTVGPVFVGDFPCYVPPDFSKIVSEGERKLERQKGYQEVEKLVTGEALDKAGNKLESFRLSDDDFTFFETAFLGRPQLLDDWLADNLKRCKAVGEGKAKRDEYATYLTGIGREFEANECYKPLVYEFHDFLDIQTGWQWRVHACRGDSVIIESTGEDNGKYTVEAKDKASENKYITASGDQERLEAGEAGLVAEVPFGALIMRFEAEDGSYNKIYLVGATLGWEAPDHGYISFSVNDTVYYDNKFHDLKGGVDYLGIDIYPADKKK